MLSTMDALVIGKMDYFEWFHVVKQKITLKTFIIGGNQML